MAKFTENQPATSAALASQPVRDNLDALFQMDLKSLRPRAQSAPNMTLQVAADQDTAYYGGNTPLNYSGGNSPSITAPSGNNRISVLTVDAFGTLSWTNGTEAASPTEPTIPDHVIPLCSVFCRVGMTSIKNTDDSANGYIFKDRRPFINSTRTQALYGSVGLMGYTNSISTYDVYADGIMFRGRGTNFAMTTYSVGSLQCRVNSGPVIGGRDMAGTFAAGSWVHMYQVTDTTTYGLLASSSAPPTGPNSVANGHTHWNYVGTVRFNASSQFAAVRIRGNTAFYDAAQLVLSDGTAAVPTSVSIAGVVPPNAMSVLMLGLRAGTNNNFYVQVASGQSQWLVDNVGATLGSFEIPNVGQNFLYMWDSSPAGGAGQHVYVVGYKMPNNAV
jgi:hypothetical protein